MAESSGEKTEMPTPKKLRDARQKGQVCSSKDIVSTAILVVLFALLAWMGMALADDMDGFLRFLSTGIERNGVERDIYYHYAAAFSQTAMKHLLRKGYDFILVCAAGNDPVEAKWASEYAYITDPMIRDRIIVVGAAEVDRDGHYSLTYFSARGERMDVVAPGMDIYSTMPGGGFDYMSGTSMATPHVTGVTASVWAIAPNLSGAEVKRIVVSTATTPVAGTDVGMINMEAAMAAAEAAAR